MPLDARANLSATYSQFIYSVRGWCNGNTTHFDCVVLGSSPSSRAKLIQAFSKMNITRRYER